MSGLRTASGALVATLVVAVMLVAWALLGRGIALALAKTSPELALRFHAADPEALVRINEAETDAVVKARRAREVLGLRPLDGRAYRQLAEIEQEAGRPDTAAALFRVALRYTPRDRLAQAWMADDALAREDTPEAMERLILLADMDATLWPGLFPYLRQLSLPERALSGLVVKLAADPPWRSQFLSAWEQESPATFDAVMLALEGRNANLTAAERELWVRHLLQRQRWSAAYMAWTGGLDTDRRPSAPGVFNGGFEAAPAGYFDWSLAPGGGNRKDLLATAGASGERALRVQFTGQPGASVEQILLLPPGAHAFQARTRLEGLRTEWGLVWSVRCMRDQTLLGAGPDMRDSRDWHSYGFRFDVPLNCPTQRLTLELPGRTELERRIEGVAWFDDVAITPALDPDSRTPAADAMVAQDRSTAAVGVPAALLLRGAGQTTIKRAGRTLPATPGALLLEGDRVAVVPPATATVRWRDDCQREVAAVTVSLESPCPKPAPASLPPVHPRAMDIVRASLAAYPGSRGSSGADLPVGP